MHRNITIFAAASALAALAALPASAHATLEKAEASAGSYKAVLRIPHGCDGQATNQVRLEIPEGYIGVKPMPKPGWTVEIEKGDYDKSYNLHGEEVTSGVTAVIWKDGDLPDEFYDEFVVNGTLSGVEPGQQLFFKTTQTCAEGEVAWTEEPAEGQNPHDLEHPAPILTVSAGADEHMHHGHGGGAEASEVKAGDLTIGAPWARAMLPGQPAGGGYLTVTNAGSEADRLIGVSSPAAGKVEIHTMSVTDGVMTMRPVEGGLEIPAGATVELKPGGEHIMFMQVETPFKEGDTVPLTLEFEKAGKVEVSLPVRSARGGEDHSKH
ncbi:MAG TPA: DUF1775 domain-containing protein [Rhizobiaceae bacterium]|nr:DUF1775 domain-containing protein [Rhizobiaceae bacterium]